MEKFALGVSIGAALTGAFHSTLSTSQEKIQGLADKVKSLGAQKVAVENVRAYRTELTRLTTSIKPGAAASAQLRAQINSTRKALRQAKTEARSLGVNTRLLAAEEKRLAHALARTNKKLAIRTKLAGNKATRKQLHGEIVEAVAAAGAVVVPVKAAISFESSMADVGKVVDLDEPGGIKALGKDILDLSTKIPMAADGIASIVESAGQSGLAKTRSELIDYARMAATMGVAFDLSGEDSGQMLAAWRSGMKLNQKQALGLADAVNYLSNKMNAQAGPLGEVVRRQGAVAMSAGLSETQVASLGAALLSSGTGPEIAATAMKNLTGALTRGEAATGRQEDALKALGMDAMSVAKEMQQDAVGTIKKVFSALKDAAPEEQSSLVSQLFGEESKGAIMPLLANLENLEKAFELTSDKTKYAGSMQAEYDVRSKTTANNLQLLMGRVTRLGVNLGTALLPGLNAVLVPLGAIADGLSWVAGLCPPLTAAVVGMVAAFLLAKPVMFAVKYGMTVVSDAVELGKFIFGGFSDVVQWTTAKLAGLNVAERASAVWSKLAAAGQWLWNKSLSAGAFVGAKARTIALGISQKAVALGSKIAAGAQWLWNTSLSAGAFVGAKARTIALGTAQKAVALGSKVAAGAQWLWNTSLSAGAFVGAAARVIALGAAGKAVAAGTKLWTAAQWALNVALNANPIGLVVIAIAAVIGLAVLVWKKWEPIKAFFGRVWSKIAQGAIKCWEKVKGWSSAAMEFLKDAFLKFTPLGWIIQGMNAAKNWLETADWSRPGKAIVETLAAGMKATAMAPVNAVIGMFGKVRQYLPFSDAKAGPLSKLTASGSAFSSTFAGGMAATKSQVEGQASSVAASASKGLQKSDSKPGIARVSGAGKNNVGNSQRVVIHFNPTIHIAGGTGKEAKKQTGKALSVSRDQLRRMIEDVFSQERRVSYA